MVEKAYLIQFLNESLKIEGINRPCSDDEIEITINFLAIPKLTIPDVIDLVKVYEPKAILRDKKGLNVRVGNYFPPSGGPQIYEKLEELLVKISSGVSYLMTPFEAHCEYETLHPFTDGNGRSGRVIWLWHMKRKGRRVALPFLHHWYYQTLDGIR